MNLFIYRFLTVLFSPIIDLYIFIRLLKKKENKIRIKERFGYPTVTRPDGKIIWFQCASVGETNSALPLIEKIIEKCDKNVYILITTGTTTSSNMIIKKIAGKPNIIHQYTPIDKYFVIKRFLKYWKPTALITVESEIWPNMISMTHKSADKVMIVNAKISEKSFRRWGKFKSLKEEVFDSIDICYPQSQEDQYRLINLGVQNTIYLGNLKFDIPKLKINEQYMKILKDTTKERTVLLCASTHKNEDKVILELYKKLKKDSPNILIVIALRHPNRSDEVYNLLLSNNLIVKRKSLNEIIDLNTNFYIYDEMGEMGTLFESFDLVLMCGSLVKNIGGHTPIEPAKHKCAILTGPYIENNKSLFAELQKNNACIICQGNSETLVNNLYNDISSLIINKNKIEDLKENAYSISEKFSNVSNDVAKNIITNLN